MSASTLALAASDFQPASISPQVSLPTFLKRSDVIESQVESGLFNVKICRNCQSSILDCICDSPVEDLVPIYRAGQGTNQRLAHYLRSKHQTHTAEKATYQAAIESGDEDPFRPNLERPAAEMRTRMTLWPDTTTSLPFFQSIALPLAARGLKVFPVRGKEPFINNHPEEASSDSTKITETWAQYGDCNVAVMGRQQDGYPLILDVDGFDAAAAYKAATGKDAPVTYTVQSTPPTAGEIGKQHWYFWQTPRTLALPQNISERSTNGEFSLRLKNQYVVGEGSWHYNKDGKRDDWKYEAISDVPILPMPDDFLDWLLSRVRAESKKPATIKGDLIPYGQHDSELFRIGCNLRRDGAEEEAIYNALCEVCLKRCENYGPDWKEMCRKKAHQAATKYPVGKAEPRLILDGVVLGADSDESAVPVSAVPSTEWGVPQPFKSELSPVLPFRLDFLPTALQPWARDVAERMSTPLDFAGICSLIVLAGIVNRRAFVYPKQLDKEWKEALSISGAVVASSGKLKTPTWKTFTNPLVDIEYTYRETFDAEMREYTQELRRWENDKKSNGPIPQKPVCKRIIVNDSTPEKLHDIMAENPAGLFVYRDELSSWVAELDKKDREVARGLYLAAMNGNDPYTMDRIQRGSVCAIMSASLFGGFQPEMLIDFLSETRNINDGLIPRFGLLVWPDSVELPRIDRIANEQAKARFRSILKKLGESEACSIYMHFAAPAQSRFNAWLDTHDKKVNREPNPGRQSHLSKYRGLLPKLAALLQLADIVDAIPSVAGNQVIDLDHLNRAIALLEYLESHMTRIYGCIKSPLQKAESALADRIRSGDLKDGFSAYEIKRKHWAHLSLAEHIEDALTTLEDLSWVRALPGFQGRGRPTIRWEINPALTNRSGG